MFCAVFVLKKKRKMHALKSLAQIVTKQIKQMHEKTPTTTTKKAAWRQSHSTQSTYLLFGGGIFWESPSHSSNETILNICTDCSVWYFFFNARWFFKTFKYRLTQKKHASFATIWSNECFCCWFDDLSLVTF